MNIRKRRSDRSGRVRLFSPGRPPVAGREERRRFWAAIAAGTASEDAAVGVGVPQAVGTRWFRKAGACRHRCLGYRRSRSVVGISRLRSGGDRAPSRSGLLHAGGRSPARASGIDNLQRAAAQRRHPKRRPRVSCDDSAMARRARCSPPKAGEACAQRGVKNSMSRNGWLGSLWLRAGLSVPGPVVSWKSRRHGPRKGPAMGKRLEPGADRPSPARWTSRTTRDHAHQP